MKLRNALWALLGCACLAWVLSDSVARAEVVQVDAGNPPDSEFNHLECYKVTEDPGLTYYFDLIANDTDFLPANTLEKGCRLRRKADSLCIDTRTRNISPDPLDDGPRECANGTPCSTDADCVVQGAAAGFCSTAVRTTDYGEIPNAWDYICYKIRCDRQSQPGPGLTQLVKDRFGQRSLKVRRAWKVCVPILGKGETP